MESNLGPLHRDHGVLAIGPTGQSPVVIFFFFFFDGHLEWCEVICCCTFDLCAFVKLRSFFPCSVFGEFLSQTLVELFQKLSPTIDVIILC